MSFDSVSLYTAIQAGDDDRISELIRLIDKPCGAECCTKGLISQDCSDALIRQALDQFVSIHATSRHACWVKHAGYLLPVLWDIQALGHIIRIHNIVFQSTEPVPGTFKLRIVQAAFAAAQNPTLEDEQDLDDLGLSQEALSWLDMDQYPDIRDWIKSGKMPAKPKGEDEQD